MSASTVGGHPERPGQDVPLGVDGGLLFGHFAVPHPLLGQAVIVGDLNQPAVGEHVGRESPTLARANDVLAPGSPTSAAAVSVVPMPAEVGVDLALVPHRGVGL